MFSFTFLTREQMLYRDSNVKLTGPSIGLSVSKNWLSTDISGGTVGTQKKIIPVCAYSQSESIPFYLHIKRWVATWKKDLYGICRIRLRGPDKIVQTVLRSPSISPLPNHSVQRTVIALITLRGCAGLSGSSLSAYAVRLNKNPFRIKSKTHPKPPPKPPTAMYQAVVTKKIICY